MSISTGRTTLSNPYISTALSFTIGSGVRLGFATPRLGTGAIGPDGMLLIPAGDTVSIGYTSTFITTTILAAPIATLVKAAVVPTKCANLLPVTTTHEPTLTVRSLLVQARPMHVS